MRKVALTICALLISCAAGCASAAPHQSVFPANPLNQSAPEATPPRGVRGLEAEAPLIRAAEGTPSPAVTVLDTAAYIFQGMEGPALYGAAAYENTGNCPVIITQASFSFGVQGESYHKEFLPAMNQQSVVLPGEISYVTCWHTDQALTPGSSVSLSATLTCQPAEGDRASIAVKNIYLADNYPGFTTMTGSISADKACELNLIYTGFYDSSGDFIGAWHFTKNARLDPGDEKTFTVHMKALPIPGLAKNTSLVQTYGIGF